MKSLKTQSLNFKSWIPLIERIFLGINQMRIVLFCLVIFGLHLICFLIIFQAFPRYKCYMPPRVLCQRYSEAGPGARSCLNQLEGNCKTWNATVNNQPCADYYSGLSVKYWKVWRSIGRELLSELPESLHHHVQFFLSPEFDEVCFQFMLCELSKIINFITAGTLIYLRTYWNTAFGWKLFPNPKP